jgi:hypothetical protein
VLVGTGVKRVPVVSIIFVFLFSANVNLGTGCHLFQYGMRWMSLLACDGVNLFLPRPPHWGRLVLMCDVGVLEPRMYMCVASYYGDTQSCSDESTVLGIRFSCFLG